MAENKETLTNMVLSLLVIAVLSGAVLASTHTITEPVIAQGRALRLRRNLESVLGEFNNNPSAESFQRDEYPDLVFFPARKGEKLTSLGVQSLSTGGWAGDVVVLAGFRADGGLINVVVQQQRETPGLGTRMTDKRFLAQFLGRPSSDFPLSVEKDGGRVDAITAATISSRAFLDALNKAQSGAKSLLPTLTLNEEATE